MVIRKITAEPGEAMPVFQSRKGILVKIAHRRKRKICWNCDPKGEGSFMEMLNQGGRESVGGTLVQSIPGFGN